MRSSWFVVGTFVLGFQGGCTVLGPDVDGGLLDGGPDASLPPGGDGGVLDGAGPGDAAAPGDAATAMVRSGIAMTGERPEEAPGATDGKQAGSGGSQTDTLQKDDPGDPIWTLEEDVDGDGLPETVHVLFDDETGELYVWYTIVSRPCTTTVTTIFDGDGAGEAGDGSGRYLVEDTCDASTQVLGCEFDAEGNDTECGVCSRDPRALRWRCAPQAPPFVCACDVDNTCSPACTCDVECLAMCACDVDATCSDNCDCDFECVFGECQCDTDFSCTADCVCDLDCN